MACKNSWTGRKRKQAASGTTVNASMSTAPDAPNPDFPQTSFFMKSIKILKSVVYTQNSNALSESSPSEEPSIFWAFAGISCLGNTKVRRLSIFWNFMSAPKSSRFVHDNAGVQRLHDAAGQRFASQRRVLSAGFELFRLYFPLLGAICENKVRRVARGEPSDT